MAPEVIEMKPPTPKSDIWSVGCVCLEILTGKPPYYNLTPMSALFHICSDAAVPIDDPSHIITPECLSFLKECFVRDAQHRKSAAELLSHPWFKKHGVSNPHRFSMDETPSAKPLTLTSRMSLFFSSHKAHSSIHRGTTTFAMPIQAVANPAPLPPSAEDLLIDINDDDINKMIDEAEQAEQAQYAEQANLALPHAPPPSATNIARSFSSLSRRDSAGSESRGNDELQVESELLESTQIVAEAASGENTEPSEVVLAALQKILDVVTARSFGCSVLVCNNGLYPLVSIVIKNTNNLAICHTSLQVAARLLVHR